MDEQLFEDFSIGQISGEAMGGTGLMRYAISAGIIESSVQLTIV